MSRRSQRPGALSRRLAIQLGTITALVVGAALGFGLLLLDQQRSDALSFEIERARRAAIDASNRQFERLEADANALVRRIEGDPDVLAQLLGRRPSDPGMVERLGRSTGLEVLDLVDPEDTVVVSLHWPERAGLPAGPPQIFGANVWIETPHGARAGMQTGKEIRVGSRRLRLVAGRFRGGDWLREVAALADAAWWFPSDHAKPLEYAPSRSPEDLPQFSPTEVVQRLERGRWQLVSVRLDDAPGRSFGALVFGFVDRSQGSAWVGLRAGWAALTIAAALTSALLGSVIGRRAARPVNQLVRAVDAIAAGEEDYSFPGAAQDEFEQLTASFSRLQRSLERQQRRSAAAERIAAWREVARHVAHEVKNPLAPIRLTVQNLQRARVTAPERFDALFTEGTRTILEEVDQLARLVGEFSEFARLPAPDRRSENVETILEEVLELYASRPELVLTRRLCGRLPQLALDRDQISSVFKNILGNAIEAQRGSAQASVRVATRCHEGQVEIEFADGGPGFGAEAALRVFEPYFTTKEHGTGLGMAISYRVVAEHGGEIIAENLERGGARVTVRLPPEPSPGTVS